MPVPSNPSQEFVPIQEIRDGIAILKDGGMRAILMSSSINFALKSPDNQEAIIMQFQNFLNSLDFSIQVFIQSRRLDIRPYLALLEERSRAQTTDLMKLQITEYIDFIKSFTADTNIMTKSFFVVVPYTPGVQINSGKTGGVFSFMKKQNAKELATQKTERFEESRSQLEQRVAVIEQGLSRCGLRIIQLGTEEVTELFYKLFNPGETEKPVMQ